MPTIPRFPLFVAVLAVTGILHAAGEFDAAARARAVAPFIDEQTILVARVDLTRVQLDPLLDKFLELVPEAEIEAEEARTGLKRAQQVLLKAGGRELFVVVSLAEVPKDPPVLIVPLGEHADVDAVRAGFPPGGAVEVVQEIDGALFLGTRRTLERLKSSEPDVRPDLVLAFEAAGDTAAQLLLLPPAHTGRVIEEIMPTLPEEIGGGPSAILARGLLWAAVGVESPPKMFVRLVVQSQDREAATALRGKWLDVVRLLSVHEQARKLLPNFEQAAALLTPNVQGDRLVLTLDEEDPSGGIRALSAVITPPFEEARARAHRSKSMDQLKQLGLAMHNYHDSYMSFPAVGSTDASGKPLLSWRVHILPYVEQLKLYEQFHLDEPWDSEHNRRLIEKMPETYRCPASKHRQKQGLSTYRVVSGEGTLFPGLEGIPMEDIKDGTSNTIEIVEVDDDHAVIWTKPEGLPFDPENPARGLGGQFKDGFHAAFCDGSAMFFKLPADDEMLRRFLLRADGEPVSRWW